MELFRPQISPYAILALSVCNDWNRFNERDKMVRLSEIFDGLSAYSNPGKPLLIRVIDAGQKPRETENVHLITLKIAERAAGAGLLTRGQITTIVARSQKHSSENVQQFGRVLGTSLNVPVNPSTLSPAPA